MIIVGPPSAPVTPAIVLASDSFNRADTAANTIGPLDYAQGGIVTGLTWLVSAQMQIISNQVGGTVSTARFASVDTLVTDGYAEVEVVAVDGGVCGRFTDVNNCYVFRYISTTNNVFLDKRIGGVSTNLWASATGVFTPGAGQKLGLLCEGSTISGYINGILVTTVTDTSITTGTRWGMRSGSASTAFRLDNWIMKNTA